MTLSTSPDQQQDVFAQIVDNWDAVVPCQHLGGCRRPATWLGVLHRPCGHVSLCGHHKNRWLKNIAGKIDTYGLVHCWRCAMPYFEVHDLVAAFTRIGRS